MFATLAVSHGFLRVNLANQPRLKKNKGAGALRSGHLIIYHRRGDLWRPFDQEPLVRSFNSLRNSPSFARSGWASPG